MHSCISTDVVEICQLDSKPSVHLLTVEKWNNWTVPLLIYIVGEEIGQLNIKKMLKSLLAAKKMGEAFFFPFLKSPLAVQAKTKKGGGGEKKFFFLQLPP